MAIFNGQYVTPEGKFLAWHNYEHICDTPEQARVVFAARHDADRLMAAAMDWARRGWQGDTNDRFNAAYLTAHGVALPEYPAELQERHAARNANFFATIAEFAADVRRGIAATANNDELLAAGQRESDKYA